MSSHPTCSRPSSGRRLLARGLSVDPAALFSGITWIYPNRPLTREFKRVAAEGYVKGADLWHLARALFLAPDPRDLAFFTLGRRQEEIARKLGFTARVPTRPL